ncbi:hypothetical protein VNO77_13509 [Canavalia gladiata]|uniref:Uncharacterized protein n=1 Tax=Canavalia gladiata TaxID=3824 RepID=A0AAN9LXY7_CANGL
MTSSMTSFPRQPTLDPTTANTYTWQHLHGAVPPHHCIHISPKPYSRPKLLSISTPHIRNSEFRFQPKLHFHLRLRYQLCFLFVSDL